jgi:Putative Ig domain/VHL beta domain
MNRGWFVALLLAFLCCVLAVPASAQTASPTINALCSQCHPSAFLHDMTAGNAYNCNIESIPGVTQCGWGPLVMRMNSIENTWSSSDIATMITYLETNLSVASPNGSFPPGTAGVAYTPVTMTGVTTSGYEENPPGPIPGGNPPFNWAATGLPSGITLNSGGVLSGTPAFGSQNTYTVQITIQDTAYPGTPPTPIVVTTRTLVINPGVNQLSITGPASLSGGTQGIPYGPVTFTASGGAGGYTWSVTGLPTGMNIDPPTGALGGIPTVFGNFNPQFTVTDTSNATFSKSLPLTINPAPNQLNITGPASLSAGTEGIPYGPVTFTAGGGVPPYTWSASGLPNGLSINPSTGLLGGTPAAGSQGAYSLQFAVRDSSSAITTRSLALTINPAVSACTTLSSPGQNYLISGGTTSLSWSITTIPASCAWTATGSPLIQTITPSSGVGTSDITATFAPNNTASLAFDTVTVTSGGVSIPLIATRNPNSCLFTPSAPSLNFAAAGGTQQLSVTSNLPTCLWFLLNYSSTSWLTVPSSSMTGSQTINVTTIANPGSARADFPYFYGSNNYSTIQVTQEGVAISGLSFIGSMAHLAAQENWISTFTLVNKSASSATARLSFFGDATDPAGNGPLAFALDSVPPPASLFAASLDQTLAANASSIASSEAWPPPVLVGSAQLNATGAVDGFTIFHQNVTSQEAVVPMETRNASSYLLAFDNTNGLVLGVAVENISAQNTVIPVIIRDDAGVVISSPVTTLSLGANGHTSFVLSDPVLGFPVTANIRGTIEFDTPAGGRIGVLGLRFTPPNNALTTIPALVNVGTGGGSIAHLASGGDGWQTTFVLVNTGTSAAPMTLNFFADQTGAPLSLPLSFPQSGGGNATVASSVPRTLGAGAMLLIVSDGAPQLLTGSAQLTTTGNISGFVIFRHNGQEAVVPLESRNADGYIVAFDNTNGTATGIALNAVSTQAVNVPVVVRSDAGTQIATDTIPLNPNGHYAFTLGTDKYPATAAIRGTIEFDTPAGAQIGAVGIRIPSGAAHTYTTLPALAISSLNSVPELTPLPCSQEASLKSMEAIRSASITFSNVTSQVRQIYWLDYSGNRVLYNTLAPGASYLQQTYLTDPWVVTNSSGGCIAIYLPGPGGFANVTITQ